MKTEMKRNISRGKSRMVRFLRDKARKAMVL